MKKRESHIVVEFIIGFMKLPKTNFYIKILFEFLSLNAILQFQINAISLDSNDNWILLSLTTSLLVLESFTNRVLSFAILGIHWSILLLNPIKLTPSKPLRD